MKIFAKVKPNSKEDKIERQNEENFILWVKAPAKEDKANDRAKDLLSRHFDVPKSMITILRGEKSRNKVFNIERE